MSKTTEQKYFLKNSYFTYLKDTAVAVDPYVKKVIVNSFKQNLQIRETLLSRYRFGKPQLRPALARLSYELVGGKNWQKIIPACGALEVRDTGYYCYDDVVDFQDDPVLFLIANAFITISDRMMLSLNNLEIMAEVFVLDEEILMGGFTEFSRIKNEKDYLEKAIGFNFWERAFRIGALLGGADNKMIDAIGEIGKNIGIAYIIANDTWDFGKELSDFISGKYTLPILWAMKNASLKDRKTIRDFFGTKLSVKQKDQIKKIIIECGAIAYGKNRASEYCTKAEKLLQKFKPSIQREMIQFSMSMTQKNKYYSSLDS